MVFISYTYGTRKRELRELLRDRLRKKEMVRHHQMRLDAAKEDIVELEKRIDEIQQQIQLETGRGCVDAEDR